MFHKPLTELVKADVLRLVEERVTEGIDIEFKESLPTKNNSTEPWSDGKDKISSYARNKLLEEIIAFANAYGGVLCIGISESDDIPAYANSIREIPKCLELAERLKLQCRDCIEPQIPLIESCGVVTDDNGGGVVIINVPQSRLAPHRHIDTRECYIRRADRTEKMTMREIQDLTLYTERGMARIEACFKEKKDKFEERLKIFRKDVMHKNYGIRMTVIPTSDIHVNDVHNRIDVKSNILTFKGTFDGKSSINLFIPLSNGAWKPILRGTYSEGIETDYFFSVEFLSNGLIELILLANENDHRHIIFPSWFMGMVCNTLYYLQRVRNATDTHNLEYALEIQINNVGGPLSVDGYGSGYTIRPIGTIKESNVVFPRYSVGPSDSFQQLTNIVESDFWNHSGVESSGDNIQINFDQLIK